MYADFFRENKKQRAFNPTYVSNHFVSTLVYPNKKQDPQLNDQYNNSPVRKKITPYHLQTQENKHEKQKGEGIKSNLSSYGSSSLKQLRRISDHDITRIQKKDFNIITLNKGNENNFYDKQKQKEKVSGKITQMPVYDGQQESHYMGVSTIQQNKREQVKQKIKNRPYFLNNAHQIQF